MLIYNVMLESLCCSSSYLSFDPAISIAIKAREGYGDMNVDRGAQRELQKLVFELQVCRVQPNHIRLITDGGTPHDESPSANPTETVSVYMMERLTRCPDVVKEDPRDEGIWECLKEVG